MAQQMKLLIALMPAANGSVTSSLTSDGNNKSVEISTTGAFEFL
ncbi:hypothetical protein CASFOL_018244 [Castilleja foliolosa]|uniref:Uncharacterized protein n=1 Tax=Castilleja foliolosa TaxID=1961234 RepID=A0ABD3DA00_9LAMI